MNNIFRNFLKFMKIILPYGFYIVAIEITRALRNGRTRKIIAKNLSLKNTHKGERCIILGNGPSVGKIDMNLLIGETVISVSSGYLHKKYKNISPKYHCAPQITYNEKSTYSTTVEWFNEMHLALGPANLFLNITELPLVMENNIFHGRDVFYVDLNEDFDEWHSLDIIDISKPIPRVQSVPILTLMIAMYLGFKEIILIGMDHDQIFTGTYNYAFETTRKTDVSVSSDGTVVESKHDVFQNFARLWRQYRILHGIAKHNGVQIYNATPGGALDEFERKSLDEILSS